MVNTLRPNRGLSLLLGLLLFIFAGVNTALAELPASSAIASQLEKLKPDDTSPATQALREAYEKTQSTLESLGNLEQRTQTLNEQIARQPEELQKLRDQLAEPPQELDISAAINDVDHLEQQVIQTKAELVQQEQLRDELDKSVQKNDEQLINLRAELAHLKQSPAPSENLSSDMPDELRQARRTLEEVLTQEQAKRAQTLELELLVLPGENELSQLKLALARRKVSQLSNALDQMQSVLGQQRRSELESTLASVEPAPDNLPEPLAEVSRQNRSDSDSLRQLVRDIEVSNNRQRELETRLSQIGERYRLVQQQLELDIPQLNADLHRFARQLIRPIDLESTRANISRLRLAKLNTDRDLLNAKQLRADPPQEVISLGEDAQAQYDRILENRIRLLEQIQQSRQQLINARSQMLSTQQQINEQLQQARALVDQHLLWQPTIAPINSQWGSDLIEGLSHLKDRLTDFNSETSLLRGQIPLWAIIALPLLLAALSVALRRYFKQHRERWHDSIGRVTQDRFSRTLKLLVGAPIIAAPIPVLALLLQQDLNPAHPLHDPLSPLLYLVASFVFIAQCIRGWLTTPYGLLNGHLELPAKLCRILNRELQILCIVSLPLLAGLIIADGIEEQALLASGGRLLFLLLTLALTRFWWVMWKTSSAFNQLTSEPSWWQDSRLWIGSMIGFNLLMFGLGLAGFLFGALFLMLIFAVVILQIALVFMVYRLGVRWLQIEERRLAFKQALEKRAEQIAARENPEEEAPVEENYYDLKTISLQTRTLLKISSLALLFLGLWLTMGDFLPTLHILDRVPLWSTYQSTADGQVLEQITLADIAGGVLILGLSLLAAYNLPGLVELLILRHIHLTPGSNFAITTLLKYSLILVGTMSGVSQFGLEWSKLQWLVAALGVGLGFGLQEIVANFVSGIILLFEKPIRIGDTVTIGDVTGNVSRIQIRATTLVDWDNKEVIIPNKTFITERLINWSLTDATTRIVLTVGAAYGSDTQKVKELLVQAAEEHSEVLEDPAPSAYFRAFGESSLDFDLRVYVSRMEDRIPVTDGLNHRIDRLFKDAGIEIAFPQLDVHLFRTPPNVPKS
ncbi:mechanosensitive ion channel domain-containing protein [Marinobacterium lutimaris]|uniref:Potassium efflux system protein n=1 Tax=Marinobacterium lutimaris TaxID=568106 RepID=A0A1H6DB96_9GAMM|nr:mechanosensitive ion channel domain-containing protein [Marinobacterium lutimaris]SEG81965.1 potassium efflux system protein [Marinobacterium lutimaris]